MTKGKIMRTTMVYLAMGVALFGCGDKNGQQPIFPSTTVPPESTTDTSAKSLTAKGTESDTATDDSVTLNRQPRTKWICPSWISDSCRNQVDSKIPDQQWLKTNCPSCQHVTERVIGTPSEEALKTHEGDDYPDKNKFDRIESTEFFSLIDLFELCHKGNVNCQEYYLDGVLGVIPCIGGKPHLILGDYTDYHRPYNPERKGWKKQPMIVLNMPNNLITGTTAGDQIVQKSLNKCFEGKPNRTDYKIRFKKILWKYDNILWDPFPYSNPDAPPGTTIVQGKHCLLANTEQIEVFYDPDNLLKPAMRIYPEELAAEEDAKGIIWNDDAVKKSGLKSVRLIDATVEILNDMEKNPYIKKIVSE